MTKSSPSIWHLLSKRQIDGEDFIIFCGLLKKHELYVILKHSYYDITKDPRHATWNQSCSWWFFFFCSSFFGRGQLIKSALQHYQILNEGNLKWRYFYWSIHATMLQNINKKTSCEIEAVDKLFQPLMNHLFNPTTLH